MKVLGIDTSTRNLSIALRDNDIVLAEFNGKGRLRHSQDLIPEINSILESRGLKLDVLDGFAISIGPGSFTGLRIGTATLKALNLVTNKPILAVPTLDVIANNIKQSECDICVIVDAKKNKVYSCLYKMQDGKIERKTDYLLITIEDLLKLINLPTLFLGDGIHLYKKAILDKINSSKFAQESLWFPKASVVTKLGAEKLKKGEKTDGDKLTPMYLYSRECSIRGVDR